MPPKRSRAQGTRETSSTESMSQGSENPNLTAAQIAQLVAATVEQILENRPELHPPPDKKSQEASGGNRAAKGGKKLGTSSPTCSGVDWAVKMRIRPPEFETSICDAKYHVSLVAIGSLATLDLPMVVDLIGIYGLKGPYCTLTTTDWFLQALSVIPRGSWGDVARRFTMIRWESPEFAAAARCRRKFVSGQLDEENPFVLISSVLLVQPDEGVSVLVVDRIGDNIPQSTEKSRILVILVGARHKCQQDRKTNIGKATRRAAALSRARWTISCRALAARHERWWPGDCTMDGRDVLAPSRRYCMSRPDVIARAGRTSCTMVGRSTLHAMADDGRRLSRFVSRGRACDALLAARCRLLNAPPGRALLVDDARRSRDVARCRREFSLVVAPPSPAAAPASFRRCRDGWSDFF
ncbi:acyl-CoA dehydrogenase-related protein [Dorcoceras hygrometricum]|uniref:Acyl-CoA dehydrogenase-related protein n=1 Tax=Dorcoceras hygrometricum TaxID=472368 RepID=A0A2Z7CWS2_9LAMI|nr:acyl-CoA dehydrogenase-related protein [Dorcoceras hygrometricum]